jgi:hypothetical protein
LLYLLKSMHSLRVTNKDMCKTLRWLCKLARNPAPAIHTGNN